jgi:hypothetical protein
MVLYMQLGSPILYPLRFSTPSLGLSPMGDMGNGPIVVDMDIEPVGLEVLGDHHPRLDNTRLLGEVRLAEGLHARKSSAPHRSLQMMKGNNSPASYRLRRRLVRQSLSDELVHPLLRLVVAHVVGCHSGNNERHLGCVLLTKR